MPASPRVLDVVGYASLTAEDQAAVQRWLASHHIDLRHVTKYVEIEQSLFEVHRFLVDDAGRFYVGEHGTPATAVTLVVDIVAPPFLAVGHAR